MPAGDRQRTSFPEMVETLRAGWKAQTRAYQMVRSGGASMSIKTVELTFFSFGGPD